MCLNCSKKKTEVTGEVETGDSALPQTLIVIAVIMIIAGVILLVFSGTTASQGSFVIIFPFTFASSTGSSLILIPTIGIVVLMIILTLLSLRRSKGAS